MPKLPKMEDMVSKQVKVPHTNESDLELENERTAETITEPREKTMGVGFTTTDDPSAQHITGIKLFAVLTSISMAAVLMLLDGSIIGVICPYTDARFDYELIKRSCCRPYQTSRVNFTLLLMWLGIQRHINWLGMYIFQLL